MCGRSPRLAHWRPRLAEAIARGDAASREDPHLSDAADQAHPRVEDAD